MFHEP
jgi:hypothetical protein